MSETKIKVEVQSDGSAKPASADTNSTVVAVLDIKPLQIRLVDRKGKPMADEPFLVTLKDGRTMKGNLDLQGRAAVRCAYPLDAKVTFPRLAPSAWKKKTVVAPAKKVDSSELDIDEVCTDLVLQEGNVTYMYLDDKGNVTVGIGNLVGSASYAKTLGFLNAKTNHPASPQEVEEAFRSVLAKGKGKSAGAYRLNPSIELPTEKIVELAKRRLTKEFLPGLKKRFTDFSSLPKPARRGLIDMAYNMGLGKFGIEFDGKHRKFGPAVRRHDWDVAAKQCDVKTSRETRNAWRRAQFCLAFEQEPLPISGADK
jgi:GH24 family phage-related lysozyme (muramidase)